MSEGISFEDALEKLESISEQLANEDIPLDEAVTLYELGLSYYNICKGKLDDANRRIRVIEEDSQKI